LPLHTLRAWERRYGIPRPGRNADNRYRLYDEQDIADVLWMKRQVEQGVAPSKASLMLRRIPRAEASSAPVGTAGPLLDMQAALFDTLVQLDDAAANRLLDQAWSTAAPEQAVLDVLQPTLQQIGKEWQRNTLSVGQEHFASNLIRQRLYAWMQLQNPPAPTAPRLVAACAPQEQHELGLLIVALLAKRQGWNVTYLGQHTPLENLLEASRQAHYLLVSASTVTGLASLLPLWEHKPAGAPIVFGGEIFRLLPRLSDHIPGAFLGQDAVAAIRTLMISMPRGVTWTPASALLRAALELNALRLSLAADAVARLLKLRGKPQSRELTNFSGLLMNAALLLTDALACALAFDVPELMDVHGAWLWDLMHAHRVPPSAMHEFLDAYQGAAGKQLSSRTIQLSYSLVQRLAATKPAGAAAATAAKGVSQ
jgi:methanogenic corrinoid protein MtbC1